MDVVWNTLTWVDEKGETLFDPSAEGMRRSARGRRLIGLSESCSCAES